MMKMFISLIALGRIYARITRKCWTQRHGGLVVRPDRMGRESPSYATITPLQWPIRWIGSWATHATSALETFHVAAPTSRDSAQPVNLSLDIYKLQLHTSHHAPYVRCCHMTITSLTHTRTHETTVELRCPLSTFPDTPRHPPPPIFPSNCIAWKLHIRRRGEAWFLWVLFIKRILCVFVCAIASMCFTAFVYLPKVCGPDDDDARLPTTTTIIASAADFEPNIRKRAYAHTLVCTSHVCVNILHALLLCVFARTCRCDCASHVL